MNSKTFWNEMFANQLAKPNRVPLWLKDNLGHITTNQLIVIYLCTLDVTLRPCATHLFLMPP